MRGFVRLMAACAAAVMVSSCGGDDGGGTAGGGGGGGGGGSTADFQGTWVGCQGGGGFSDKSTLVISGTGYTQTSTFHTNDTCAGTGTPGGSDSGTVTIGSTVSANLNGSPVTSYQIDVASNALGDFYDLGYVDLAATPDRLYFGDSGGANDGSTPALRPTVLDGTFFFLRQ